MQPAEGRGALLKQLEGRKALKAPGTRVTQVKAYPSTTIGFELEYAELRIIDGGQPKTVLFKSKAKSISGEKLLQCTVDLGDMGATTELILGPVLATPHEAAGWRTLRCHLAWFYQAVASLRSSGTRTPKVQVERRYAELERPGHCTCNPRESSEHAAAKHTEEELHADRAKQDLKGSSSLATSWCESPPEPLDGRPRAPGQPSGGARNTPPPSGRNPVFEIRDGWEHAGPQVSIGVVIEELARPASRTARFFCHHYASASHFESVLHALQGYLKTANAPRDPVTAGVVVFMAMTVFQIADTGQALLDVDIKGVKYKNAWGLLPKVHPHAIWELAPQLVQLLAQNTGDQARRFAETFFDAGNRLAAARVFEDLVNDELGKQTWKPSPKNIPVFTIAGRHACVFEMRACPRDLEPKALHLWAIHCGRGGKLGLPGRAAETVDPFDMFADPRAAERFLHKLARLPESDDDDGDWPDFGSGEKIQAVAEEDKSVSQRLMASLLPKRPGPASDDDDDDDDDDESFD